jgi:cell division septal protein FtsQ
MIGTGAFVLFSLLVIGLVLWRGGQWMLNSLIYENDAFAIQQISAQTDGVLTSEAIHSWARVRIGENLMALDLMRIKHDLEMQPPIQSVAVERVLPHTLKLIVTEREPIAQTIVTLGRPGGPLEQAVYDFDPYGYTMKPLDPRWRTAPPPASQRLPILVGVAPAEAQPGQQTSSPQVRAALALLCEFDHSPMAGMVEIERIDVSQPQVLQVTTTQKAEITFSLGNFDTQFRHWRLICDQFQKWGNTIASLDLSISNNLPVHWAASSSLPPAIPHAPKPLPPKRKHV